MQRRCSAQPQTMCASFESGCGASPSGRSSAPRVAVGLERQKEQLNHVVAVYKLDFEEKRGELVLDFKEAGWREAASVLGGRREETTPTRSLLDGRSTSTRTRVETTQH